MNHLDKTEQAAEALWQSESLRVNARERLTKWEEESEETRNKYRYSANFMLASIGYFYLLAEVYK
jgi:hypothetical protein